MDRSLPELSGHVTSALRIPSELDVSVTPRVLALIDTPQMQRLRRISQLGLVSWVYPGAIHSRLEHSLGVYRIGCELLKHLLEVDTVFAEELTEREAKIFLVAALMHDVGHWPYCHPIEDMRLDWVPDHEELARTHLSANEVAEPLETLWGLDPKEVADFLVRPEANWAGRVLQNVLSGPVDIDKMDYLQRDSLHAGVPYGNNFDIGRLISSLCIDRSNSALAITNKGKTAAEMMVFARYVMFSEVYWHHAVRSATAMLQRLVYSVADAVETSRWLNESDADFELDFLRRSANNADLERLASGLWGRHRRLYKRLGQFSYSDHANVHEALGRKPYSQLAKCAELLAEELSCSLARPLLPTEVLIDAPPRKLEVQFRLSILDDPSSGSDAFSPLADRSPVVRALATEQFDNFVKQVRVFVAPDRRDELRVSQSQLAELLVKVAEH